MDRLFGKVPHRKEETVKDVEHALKYEKARTFGGARYGLYGLYLSKSHAQVNAKRLRGMGFRARTFEEKVPLMYPWAVYVR